MPADDDDGGDALSAAIKRKGKKKEKNAVLESVESIIDQAHFNKFPIPFPFKDFKSTYSLLHHPD